MSDTVIHADKLTKRFDHSAAVRDITFNIRKGTIFGFIGPSGSGKTTTIRMLTGATRPDSGSVEVLGRSPMSFDQATRAKIGYMPQHFVLYPDLTVRENLRFAASIYGMSLRRRKRMREILDFVELSKDERKPVSKISGGMQRRLSLATTLIHEPDLFFLDEPTTGIDPVLRKKFWKQFRELQQAGKTLFITTQYVSEAAYCDEVGMLIQGQLLAIDSPEGLRQQAFGGDIVELQTEEFVDDDFITALESEPFVEEVNRAGSKHIRVHVDRAGMAMPNLVNWTESHGLTITSIEEYLPSFDEVFVALVEKYTNE